MTTSRAPTAPGFRPGRTLLPLLLLLGASGCADRAVQPTTTAKPSPGTISVPFRNRWWHFYERGLSWAEARDEVRAEADFRQCLRQRQTDSRLARTYGMHFVQCFAHRELGALLLRTGRVDEAERELRLSESQEPSAKAEFLLQRIAGLRGAAAAPPSPAPAPPALAQGGSIALASVAAAPGADHLRISGRFTAAPGARLWSLHEGAAAPIATAPDGAFEAETPAGAVLVMGDAIGPATAPEAALPVAMPAGAPTLVADGPDAGAVVADGRAWYRWRADSPAGLATLDIDDAQGSRLAHVALSGLRAVGTIRLDIPAGEHVLRFSLHDATGATAETLRRVESRPGALQDRGLRAVALAMPLLAPRPGAMQDGDDPRLRSALMEDGRFRFVDLRADEILARELSLVEAGYVDRATAAEAGRRLACRYVIAGTMSRGEREAECFLRLVHCDSGRLVASADAYGELAHPEDADALFAAAAGRLRQAFPVIAGTVESRGGSVVDLDVGARAGATSLMRIHVFAAEPPPGHATGKPVGDVEIVESAPDRSRANVVHGRVPQRGWGVSE